MADAGGSAVRVRRKLLETALRGTARLAELQDRGARTDVEAALLRGNPSVHLRIIHLPARSRVVSDFTPGIMLQAGGEGSRYPIKVFPRHLSPRLGARGIATCTSRHRPSGAEGGGFGYVLAMAEHVRHWDKYHRGTGRVPPGDAERSDPWIILILHGERLTESPSAYRGVSCHMIL